jgi:hypothetical protein
MIKFCIAVFLLAVSSPALSSEPAIPITISA